MPMAERPWTQLTLKTQSRYIREAVQGMKEAMPSERKVR